MGSKYQKIIQSILLKNNLPRHLNIQEFGGGQINHTFQVGEDFVLKIQKELDVLLHQVPLVESCLKVGVKVPRIIDSGLVDGKEYILMEKISGRKLSEGWHTFTLDQRDNFITQITNELKLIHSIKFNKYSPQRPKEFTNWKSALDNHTNFIVLKTNNFDDKTKKNLFILESYYYSHMHVIDEIDTAVLVHNDLHFENILYEQDEITALFDFDFARQAPLDYELWHLIDFLHTPFYFVEETFRNIWEQYEPASDLKLFKKHYPELFSDTHLLERLRMYFIEDILGHAEAGHTDRVNSKIEAYYKSSWLEDILIL